MSLFSSLGGIPGEFVGDGVVAIAAPGIATEDSPNGEIEALERSVLLNCLDCVGGTCGGESA